MLRGRRGWAVERGWWRWGGQDGKAEFEHIGQRNRDRRLAALQHGGGAQLDELARVPLALQRFDFGSGGAACWELQDASHQQQMPEGHEEVTFRCWRRD